MKEKLNSLVKNTKIPVTDEYHKVLTDMIVPSFDYLFDPIYFNVREIYNFGSRKSAKTKHIALRFVVRTMYDPDYNALAMRKIANELSNSVKEELQWAINILGVAHLWEYKVQAREFIYTPTNQKVLLKGISINPTSGKPALSGLNISKGTIKDCWLEEAWEFTEDDYKMIRQTLRGGYYTILIVGNPYFSHIWAVRKAIELLPPTLEELKDNGQIWGYFPADKKARTLETIVHWNNFQINTKLHPADIEERWAEEQDNPKDFIVTGYGMYGSPSGTILGDLTHKIKYITLAQFMNEIKKPLGALDVGLTNDATACGFGGLGHRGDLMFAGEFYHSNGERKSSLGKWEHLDPQEMARAVIDFYLIYKEIWLPYGKFKVAVDGADRAFISILNTHCKNRGINELIKFIPTVGEKEGKKRIESRVIFWRQMLSHSKLCMVTIDDINQLPHLLYEMDNLPWKITKSNGKVIMERDDSKVPDHSTNMAEYLFRRVMGDVEKMITVKGVSGA